MPKVQTLRDICLRKVAQCVVDDSLPPTSWQLPSDLSNVVMKKLIANEKWNHRTFSTMTKNNLFQLTAIDLTGIAYTVEDLVPFQHYQLQSVKIGDSSAPDELEMPLITALFNLLGFSSCKSLTSLDLSGKRAISPVWPSVISQFVNRLSTLNVANRIVPNTSFESVCVLYRSLTCLDISNTRITDFRLLEQLSELRVLIAHNLNIEKNIEKLAKLNKLRCLDVSVCMETPDVLAKYVFEEAQKALSNRTDSPWPELISIDLGGTSLRSPSLVEAEQTLRMFIEAHPNLKEVALIGTKLQCTSFTFEGRPNLKIMHPAKVISKALKEDRPEFVRRGFQILLCQMHNHIRQLSHKSRLAIGHLAVTTMRQHQENADVMCKVLECLVQFAWGGCFSSLPGHLINEIVDEVFQVQETHYDVGTQMCVWRVLECEEIVVASGCQKRLFNAALNVVLEYPGTFIEDTAMVCFLKFAPQFLEPGTLADETICYPERMVDILRELIGYGVYNEECLRKIHMTLQTANVLLSKNVARCQRFFNFGGVLEVLIVMVRCSTDIDILENALQLLNCLLDVQILLKAQDIYRFEFTNELFKCIKYNQPQFNGREPMSNIPYLATRILVELAKNKTNWQSPTQSEMSDKLIMEGISKWPANNILLEVKEDTFDDIFLVLMCADNAPEVYIALFELWHILSKYEELRKEIVDTRLLRTVRQFSTESHLKFSEYVMPMCHKILEFYR